MPLNSSNRRLITLVVLVCSAASQAQTPTAQTPMADTGEPDTAASTWNVLVPAAQRVYWDATRDSAKAETEALQALRALAAIRKEVDAPPSSPRATAAAPATRALPTFNWTRVAVGRGADGHAYAVLSDGATRKRVAHQARLDGWVITITATGQVTAQREEFKVDVE